MNNRYPEYEQDITDLDNIKNIFVSISKNCLEIKASSISEGAYLSRMCLPAIISVNVFILMSAIQSWMENHNFIELSLHAVAILLFSFLIFMFISQIKNNSNIVFNRKTQKCYVYYCGRKHINDVEDIIISGGKTTHISLHRHDKEGKVITGDIEIDEQWNVQPIIYYIKKFLHEGESDLPIPTSRDWADLEKENVALPPFKALLHYAPWPFCGKITDEFERTLKIYLWPLYTFLLFPLYMFLSLLWYPFTKIFNIKPHPVPEEAYEDDDSIRVTPEMAAKGIRP